MPDQLKTRTVYQLSSSFTDKIYIGSTSYGLSKRIAKHKEQNDGCTSKQLIIYEDVKISPLCVIEKCTKEEIELKEHDFIISLKDICVNRRGTKGRYEPGYTRPYRKSGLESVHNKTKVMCNICNREYTVGTIKKHEKTNKHIKKFSNLS